jgi:hypothetical protein
MNASTKKRPPFAWRFTFWFALTAWIFAIIAIAVSSLFAMGFGVISLFAGSLEGWNMFWLGSTKMHALFFTPLALLLALYFVRPLFRAKFAVATTQNRVFVAFLGVAAGVTAVLGVVFVR